MSKELDALERIVDTYCIDNMDKELHIIETALKRLEVYENYNINLNETDDVDKALELNTRITIVDKVMDTQERLLASVSADEIRILSSVLNSQIRNLKKKLKALEILIKKNVKIDVLKYQSDVVFYNMAVFEKEEKLTQEEYDLLKEVLL